MILTIENNGVTNSISFFKPYKINSVFVNANSAGLLVEVAMIINFLSNGNRTINGIVKRVTGTGVNYQGQLLAFYLNNGFKNFSKNIPCSYVTDKIIIEIFGLSGTMAARINFDIQEI